MPTIDAAIDVARAELEALRWVLLCALWHARPYGCSEYVLMRAAQDIPLRVTGDVIRAELDMLAELGLIRLASDQPMWWAKLLPAGVDVVQYRAPAPAGIARPPKW